MTTYLVICRMCGTVYRERAPYPPRTCGRCGTDAIQVEAEQQQLDQADIEVLLASLAAFERQIRQHRIGTQELHIGIRLARFKLVEAHRALDDHAPAAVAGF
jgi:hypothetical protein